MPPNAGWSWGGVFMRVLNERYELVEPIGAGGMGQVWRGRDRELARTVAIKTLPVELSRQAEFRERFQREARAVAALTHPGITVLHDFGRDDSADPVPFLVMEHVDGQSLADVVREGWLPVARAAGIVRDIADALAHSHGLGIVHRDIKPSNVMLSRSGAIKVLDFGIARMLSDTATRLTTTGGIVGTPAYMSPEQAMGEQVDARTDQYSLGCVLYELLCGRPPFLGDSAFSIMNQHFVKPAPAPSESRGDVPPGLDAVLLRMLAKDPGQRFASMADVRDALGAYADNVPGGARAASAPEWPSLPGIPGPPTVPPGALDVSVAPGAPIGYRDPFATVPEGQRSDRRPAYDPRQRTAPGTRHATGDETWHDPGDDAPYETAPTTAPTRAAARRARARDERPAAQHRGPAAIGAALSLAVAGTTSMDWVSPTGITSGSSGDRITGTTLARVSESTPLSDLVGGTGAFTGLDSYIGQGVLAATLVSALLMIAGLAVSSLIRPARALLTLSAVGVIASMVKPSILVWASKDARQAGISFTDIDAMSFSPQTGLIAALAASILAMTAGQIAAGRAN